MINYNLERALLQSGILFFKNCKTKLSPVKCVYRTYCVRTRSDLLLSQHKHSFIGRYYSSSMEDDENFEYESNYANVNLESIAGNDEEKLKLLKLYQLEIDVMYQQGEKVPTYLRERDWMELLLLPSRTSRNKFLNFLWLNEIKKQNRKKKQAEKSLEFESKKLKGELFPEVSHLRYSLSANTMFHRIYETQTNMFYNFRALQAMLFGYDILVDCSYCDFMNRNEISNCVKQLVYMLGENRMHIDPFNIIFCNMSDDNILYEKMQLSVPTLDAPSFPFNRTTKGYLELYPREKLVYLTPHCKEELEKFNPDDVYIIGKFVIFFIYDLLNNTNLYLILLNLLRVLL